MFVVALLPVLPQRLMIVYEMSVIVLSSQELADRLAFLIAI